MQQINHVQYLGMQLGVDLSTSHVENNFIGTGLTPAPDVDAEVPDNCCVRPTCSAIFVVVFSSAEPARQQARRPPAVNEGVFLC